ncbi:MAG: YncE family protein [Rhodospirillaceae bacterium]
MLDNVVAVMDTGTNTVVAKVLIGVQATGIAMDPAGRFTYVAAFVGVSQSVAGLLRVIDNATNTVVATISLPARPFLPNLPQGVAVNAAGTRVYVASAIVNSLSVIDARSRVIVATVPLGGSPSSYGQFVQPARLVVPAPTQVPALSPPLPLLLALLLALAAAAARNKKGRPKAARDDDALGPR